MNDKLKALFTELKTTTMLYTKIYHACSEYMTYEKKYVDEMKKLEREIEEIQLKIIGAVKEEDI